MKFFFKNYVSPAMQSVKQVTFCARCDRVSLEKKEIDTSEKKEFSSNKCDICSISFRYKWEKIKLIFINKSNDQDWICLNYLTTTGNSGNHSLTWLLSLNDRGMFLKLIAAQSHYK